MRRRDFIKATGLGRALTPTLAYPTRMDATPATETVREPASDIPVAGSADVVTRATPSNVAFRAFHVK